MSALLWWLIPLTVTALAIAVVALIRRPRKPLADGTADFEQLREAMNKPLPHDPRRRR